jgi:ATP-dependent DNA ligase
LFVDNLFTGMDTHSPIQPWQSVPGHQLRPMLATLSDAPLKDDRLIYEPKYDGIRALIEIEPRGVTATVQIWSRLGNEKTAQFPEIVHALERFGRNLKYPVLLDGEIVALDEKNEPTGFQHLQGRIHLTGLTADDRRLVTAPQVAFVAFDILRDGGEDVRFLPLVARRARLERVLKNAA